jgi:cytochrome d ubiquinol oxidase subunit I
VDALLDPLILARWQFGVTTIYHFLFVPVTLGLVLAIAIWQTAWVRTGKVSYLRLTKLFGKMFLINFAMGVVTGIVQEFQFGMNWSDYSRFVGDVFGAPLAFEGLLAFFFEATFIGLWIFGWDKLPQKLHLATIWCVSIGSILSAYFIIAANAFMQNPVGYVFNPETNRAELTDFWALLTNPVALAAFPHTIFGALMFAAGVVISVSAWHLSRGQHFDTMRISLKFGLWAMILGISGLIIPLFINNIAAVALGVVGLIKENSKGMSITGIVTGAIGFIWAFIFWPLVVTAIAFAIAAASYSSY